MMPLQSNIKASAFSGSLALLLSLCTGKLLSQDIQFNRVAQPLEKPWPAIWGITQDTHGYMWFAGDDGLYRHDGARTRYYSHDSTNPNSLSSNRCNSVHADRDGFVWIGTFGGLDRFDPATGNFTHYRHNEQDPASISNDSTAVIFEDSEGFLWVGTFGGLNRLDKKTGKFARYLHQPNDPESLSNNIVSGIYEDKQRTLWIGTGKTWARNNVISKEGGLNRLDKNTGKFKRYLNDPKDPFTLIDNRVSAIFEDSRGTFWVGSAGDGLHTMDRITGKFERHRYDPLQPQKLSRPSLSVSWPRMEDEVRFITEDASGSIWIGTLMNGINRYDVKTKTITHHQEDYHDGGFHAQSAYCTFNSREGILWIGTWQEKIFQIDPLHTNVSYHNITKAASSIYEDSSGTVWVGYVNGLIRIGPDRQVQRRYENDSLGHIRMMAQAPAGKIWIATMRCGLALFDPITETFAHFQHDPKNPRSLVHNTVWAISDAGDGKFWVGTVGGVDQLDIKTGHFIHFQRDPQDSQSPRILNVFRLLQDSQGRLWGSRWGLGGIFRMEENGRKFKHFVQGSSIASLVQDADGRIWAGARNGLYRFDSTTDNFEVFNHPQTGEAFKHILFIVADNENCIWIYTNLALFRLSRNRDNIKIYGKNFGIKENEVSNILDVFKNRKGEIFFGDEMSGFYSFFPDSIKSNDFAPQIGFTNLWLGEQSLAFRKKGQIDISLTGANEIQLDHNQNVFSIDYAVLHYSNPEDNQHLFMLENYDNTWRKGSNELRANYFYVPPGRYIFHVKAATQNGVWTENTITIIIDPPWWHTWWAYLLYALLVGSLVYALFRYRLNKIRTQHEMVLQKQKATELEMQALRSQMNPHFIFNSLNSINMFILENDKLQALEYLSKFSRLVRLILQNSREAFIALKRELEALQLYLELESLRFEQRFEFKVSVDEEVDTTMLKVPPLLIQPYAENAIWHGLMHKKEPGHLTIELYLVGKVLHCKICDDGIGRKKAGELKSKSASINKSMGMRITADRIKNLQRETQKDIHLTVTDIVLADGSPGGTEVLIKIPVSYD